MTAPGAMYDDMLGSDEIANRSAGGTFLHPRTTFDLTYEQEDMMEEEEEEEEEEMDVRAARSDHYLRSDHAYYGGGIRRSYPVDDHDEDEDDDRTTHHRGSGDDDDMPDVPARSLSLSPPPMDIDIEVEIETARAQRLGQIGEKSSSHPDHQDQDLDQVDEIEADTDDRVAKRLVACLRISARAVSGREDIETYVYCRDEGKHTNDIYNNNNDDDDDDNHNVGINHMDHRATTTTTTTTTTITTTTGALVQHSYPTRVTSPHRAQMCLHALWERTTRRAADDGRGGNGNRHRIGSGHGTGGDERHVQTEHHLDTLSTQLKHAGCMGFQHGSGGRGELPPWLRDGVDVFRLARIYVRPVEDTTTKGRSTLFDTVPTVP